MLTTKTKLFLMAAAIVATAFLAVSAQTKKAPTAASNDALIKRGKYLMAVGSCNDCHSPKIFTAQGPVPDTTRLFSGAPADAKIPDIPAGVLGPDKWGALGSNDMTIWAGPWGVSFAANLTPDNLTGSGAWTEEAFIKALRTGKHLGAGRDILPPMPWQLIGQMKDEDLKAIYAYLKSIKPIENQVHLPIPPGGK